MLTFIWRNIWLRYGLFLLLGGFIYLGGSAQTDEARKYKDGPKAVNAESLSAEDTEYGYVELTGLNDSYYAYGYYTEGRNSEEVDTTKSIMLYYTLHTAEEIEVSIAGEQSRPAVVVRQPLLDDKRTCVDTEDCLTGGEMTVTGLLSKEPPYDDEKGVIDTLTEGGLYTLDDTTFYLDTHWKPATSGGASLTKNLGLAFMGLSGLGLAFSLFKRRKQTAANDSIIANDSNLSPRDQ